MLYAELLIIGGGLSGAMAAATAAKQGLRCLLCDDGRSHKHHSASAISSGCIDFVSADFSKPTSSVASSNHADAVNMSQVLACMQSLARQHPHHPFALLKNDLNKLDASVEMLRQLLADLHLQSGQNGQPLLLASPLGSLRQAALAPAAMAAGDLSQLAGGAVAVAHFENLPGHDGRALAASLRAFSLGLKPEQRWSTRPLSIPFFQRKRDGQFSHAQAAKLLDDPLAIKALAEAISKTITEAGDIDLLLMPAIIGLEQHRQRLFDLQALAGVQIAEIPAMGTSVPGLRMQNAIHKGLQNFGVEQIPGRISQVDLSDPQRISAIIRDSAGQEQGIVADSVLLASGHLASGGLYFKDEHIVESTANLTVFLDGKPLKNASPSTLLHGQRQAQHPLMRLGLRCDEKLHPLQKNGKTPVHSKLYAAGALLAGNDPTYFKAGLGLAALTGYLAGSFVAQSRD